MNVSSNKVALVYVRCGFACQRVFALGRKAEKC